MLLFSNGILCIRTGVDVKLFKTREYIEQENPTTGGPFRPEILTAADGAKDLGGMFGLLPPGTQVPYHFHRRRESVIVVLRGEATQVVDGKEMQIAAGDVLYIPAGEKHMTINRSRQDFRYLEIFTCPPLAGDFVEVK